MEPIRFEDYIQWQNEIMKKDELKFAESLQQQREKQAEMPIAVFYDGLNYIEKRPEDTVATGERKQRVFENRQAILGDDVVNFSLSGVLGQKRPELARNFDDEN